MQYLRAYISISITNALIPQDSYGWNISGFIARKFTSYRSYLLLARAIHTNSLTLSCVVVFRQYRCSNGLLFEAPGFDMIFSCDQAALQMVFSVFLSVRLSVRPSVKPFYYVPINVSSWNFLRVITNDKVRSMLKVKVRVQGSRSQRPRLSLTVSGL